MNWDSSSTAPPRTRSAEALPEPNLHLLTWNNGVPGFPDNIINKFPEGSDAFLQVSALKKKLIEAFPDAAASNQASQSQQSPGRSTNRARAAGQPDFTVEGGKVPLDITRLLDKQVTSASAFTVERTESVFIFNILFNFGKLMAFSFEACWKCRPHCKMSAQQIHSSFGYYSHKIGILMLESMNMFFFAIQCPIEENVSAICSRGYCTKFALNTQDNQGGCFCHVLTYQDLGIQNV